MINVVKLQNAIFLNFLLSTLTSDKKKRKKLSSLASCVGTRRIKNPRTLLYLSINATTRGAAIFRRRRSMAVARVHPRDTLYIDHQHDHVNTVHFVPGGGGAGIRRGNLPVRVGPREFPTKCRYNNNHNNNRYFPVAVEFPRPDVFFYDPRRGLYRARGIVYYYVLILYKHTT